MENRIYDSRDDVKQLILSVINGEVKKVELPMKGLHGYSKLIESLGLKYVDYNANGWAVDFTMDFKKENVKYNLSGSLFDYDTFRKCNWWWNGIRYFIIKFYTFDCI